MSDILHFETFLVAGILLNLTPGNDTVFILSKSMGQGKKAGVISAMGIGTGCIIHTILAAFGLSLIIARSIVLFNTIKYAGAAYLLYLGYRMLTDKSQLSLVNTTDNKSVELWKVYRDAALTNVLNPKVGLFFITFLPQFINPTSGNTVVPFLILGSTFTATGTIWCTLLAIFASTIYTRLKDNKMASIYLNRVCGLTLIGLGIKVAFTDQK
jgi:RhtB (resistance to homoserine/threonine) family protein